MEVVIARTMRRETGIGARWDRHTHRYHSNTGPGQRTGQLHGDDAHTPEGNPKAGGALG